MLPLVTFGGVEQVGLQVAAQYKAAGWRTRLVVTQVNEVMAPARLYDVFDTILFLNDASYASWRPQTSNIMAMNCNPGRCTAAMTG